MKFCKDCAHCVMPIPFPQVIRRNYVVAMCAHPDAKRDVVDGSLALKCFDARGEGASGATYLSICREGRLFEQRAEPARSPLDDLAEISHLLAPMPQVSEYSRAPSIWARIKELFE